MAEKQTAITPAREERRLGFGPQEFGASPFTALQRFANEVDRMFDDFGFGRRWTTPSWRHERCRGVGSRRRGLSEEQ